MGRYEQIVEDACASAKTSCASCGEFMTEDKLHLIPLENERFYSMRTPEGKVQLDNCGTIVNGSCQIYLTNARLKKGNGVKSIRIGSEGME
jgi:phosphatidylserine decarboxylase